MARHTPPGGSGTISRCRTHQAASGREILERGTKASMGEEDHKGSVGEFHPRPPICDGRMRSSTALAFALLAASAARAEEWTVFGARQMGMGGAGVASTRGARAMYWNPAALARSSTPGSWAPHSLDVAGGVSASLAEPDDTLRDLDALYRDVVTLDIADLSSRFSSGTPPTQTQLQSGLRIVATDIPALETGGALATAAAGPALRFDRFGVALTGIFHGVVEENVDTARVALGTNGIGAIVGAGQDRSSVLSPSGQSLADQMAAGGNITQNQAEELVFQAESAGVNTADAAARSGLQGIVNATAANVGGSDANSITSNQSGATVRDLFVQELAFGYGQPLGDWLAVGVAPKAMHAFTYTETFVLQNLPNSHDLLQNITKVDNDESSYQFGIDAGVLFTPFEALSVGVTGRNLNRPSFDVAGGGRLHLDPNVRAGRAF